MTTYNTKYYSDGKMHMQRAPKDSILTFNNLPDNNIVAIFQGSRGDRPDLDFVVKILMPGSDTHPTTPSHAHIATDLFVKTVNYPSEISDFISYFLGFYEKCIPFDSIAERNSFLSQSREHIKQNFSHVIVDRTLSMETLGLIIELFCYCEKRTEGAHQFKQFLSYMKDYADKKLDYIRIINLVTKFREY